jgi:membrane protein YqaA with SNARE-associated domain
VVDAAEDCRARNVREVTALVWLLCLTTIAVATAGSVLPFVPIEPYLLALPAVAPAGWLLPLALLATAGHMVGKALLYYASRRATRAIRPRYQVHVSDTRRRLLASRRLQYATILAGGIVGMPPFYVVTVLCGVLRVPVAEFLVLGTIGRAVRFVALVTLPKLVGG